MEKKVIPIPIITRLVYKTIIQQTWKNKYLEIMLKDSKDSDKEEVGKCWSLLGLIWDDSEELHCR